LKERTEGRTKGTRKGISLVENSLSERGKKGKMVKSTELSSKKHQLVESNAKASKEFGKSASPEDSLERRSKEDRPRSGEGSRRSSGLAGADLPLPESARRSITGEFIPQRSLHNSPAFHSHAGDSDSEEEVISGIFGKKTFGPKKKKEKSIDNAFLST